MSISSNRTCCNVLATAFIMLLASLAASVPVYSQKIDEIQHGFERPPDDAKIMMRWWWFGPAVTRPELEREMRLMKEGGIGGFEVQPVYPLTLDDPEKEITNFPFLSDDYIDALKFVSVKARELGLRMDLTLGSGWPFGGPQVSINNAAGLLRSERIKVEAGTRRIALPNISAGEKLLAVFLVQPRGASIDADSIQEITNIKDSVAQLPAGLDGVHEVLVFISGHTGMQVKRPAIGAEGFVLDHLNQVATARYLNKVGDRLMQAFGSQPPYAIFCDSLEVYEQDWTSDFMVEFRRRRGYDLRPFLPALIADIGPKTKGIRHDWGETISDLFNDRFLVPLHEWSLHNHARLRMQDYGTPAATLSSNSNVDLPEGEGPQWKVLRETRWASSASHLYGRPVTSSETWTWLHSPVFRASPLDLKAEADLHFLLGINQLVGHGWPYSPPRVEYPGWRFYASGVFNEKNPWWIAMPDLALYLQRVSYLLRQGQPANDVALYLPTNDAWANFSAGHVNLIDNLRDVVGPDVIPRILEAGFDFDFFDDAALKNVGRVERDALVLGANKYRVIVLPNVNSIPLETLRKLEEFVKGGGILIATRQLPTTPPGLQATISEQAEIREIVHRLFEVPSAQAHFVQDENAQLGTKLAGLLKPDMLLSPAVPEVGFIHRRSNDAEIYFVVNTSNVRQKVIANFRVENMHAESWDPITGGVSAERMSPSLNGGKVRLQLEPYESRIVVFSKRTTAPASSAESPTTNTEIDLSRSWQVSFGENGKSTMIDNLHSWTEDEETRYFSGVATYEKDFNVDEQMLSEGRTVRLDFGEGTAIPQLKLWAGMQAWLDGPVREAAVVYLNGQRAGSVWCPPYSLDLTRLLRRGENRLRIVVGNLALNYMAGHRLPDYHLLNLRYGERFQAQDMDKVRPIPSGLLGRIRLIATQAR